ncbi:MAG: hypothetical protein OXC07_03445, partial [Kistimonas sp.]|nr:hypothetical protein [Kistimonas sp.]
PKRIHPKRALRGPLAITRFETQPDETRCWLPPFRVLRLSARLASLGGAVLIEVRCRAAERL